MAEDSICAMTYCAYRHYMLRSAFKRDKGIATGGLFEVSNFLLCHGCNDQVVSEDALLLGPASLHMCTPVLHAALTAEQPCCPQSDKAMAILLKHAHLIAEEGISNGGGGGDDNANGQGLLPMSSAQPLRVALLEAAIFTCGASPAHPAAPPATFEYGGKESETASSTSTSLPPCFNAVIQLAGQGLPMTQVEWGPLLRDQGLLGPKNAQVCVIHTKIHPLLPCFFYFVLFVLPNSLVLSQYIFFSSLSAPQLAVLLACQMRASTPEGVNQLAQPNPLLESRLWLACHYRYGHNNSLRSRQVFFSSRNSYLILGP